MAVTVTVFMFAVLSSADADEEMALKRLMNIVSVLQELGDELMMKPVTGTLAMGDTTSF